MSALSLEGALRTCKVDTAYANKMQSDRILNPSNMVCPIWSGVDSAGRSVCQDSFNTKSAGCNNPLDRIQIENDVSRPQYMEYITLNAGGIKGNMYNDKIENHGQFGMDTNLAQKTLNRCSSTQGRTIEPSKEKPIAPPSNSGRM